MLELKSSKELIQFMKEKNIKFEKISEEDAIKFLETSTYYKKISSYQKNFHTYIKEGKEFFSDLDFAYLRELSTLDMHLRMLILKLCLNIEHSVKIRVINKCIANKHDGYDIVDEFFMRNTNVKNNIIKNASNSYCSELVMRHQNHFPLWVIMEVISFGDLCHMYKFLTQKGYFDSYISDILFQVHDFRNAAAHNHCLLHDLRISDDVTPNLRISQYIGAIKNITVTERKNRLKTRFFYDFITMVYSINYLIDSEGMKKAACFEIHSLFENRMLDHKELFDNCLPVKSAYAFVKKIIDFYL